MAYLDAKVMKQVRCWVDYQSTLLARHRADGKIPNSGQRPHRCYAASRKVLLALQLEALGPQHITTDQRVVYALILVCFHIRLLGKRCPCTARCSVCRQFAFHRFGIVADSVPKTQDWLRGVFTVAWIKEQRVCQIDPDGTGVGSDTTWIGVTVDQDFVLARRWTCDGKGEGRE